MSFRRMAGYSGIGFVLASIIALVVGGSPPAADAGAAEIADYLNDSVNGLKLAGVFTGLGFVFAVPFLAGFVRPLLDSDREHEEAYGIATFGGFLLTGATSAIGAVTTLVLVLREGSELDAATTRALWDGALVAYGVAVLLTVAWAGAAAMAILKHGLMPRWFGMVTGVVAVLGFTGFAFMVSGSSVGYLTFVGYLAVLVWVLVAGILMVREPA